MIIRFPTGLYSRQIPSKPSQAGSVTWVISTDDPLRPNTQIQQFPLVAQLRKLPSKDFTKTQSRQLRGDLMYSVTTASAASASDGSILFEVGQVVDSGEIELAISRPQSAPDVDLQHGNNRFDLASTGLTSDQIDQLNIKTAELLDVLRGEYSTLKSDLESLDNRISTNQKQINEVNASIEAVKLLSNDAFVDSVLDTLEDRLDALTTEKDQLFELNKTATQLVNDKYTEILRISRLVR